MLLIFRHSSSLVMPPEPRFTHWDEFYARVQPIARAIAHRRAHAHPLLRADDLAQEALAVCLDIWRRYYRRTPKTDLCKIATSAMVRRLVNVYKAARQRGEGGTQVLALDDPLRTTRAGSKLTVLDTVAAVDPQTPDDVPFETRFPLVPVSQVEVLRYLRPPEARLLQEVIRPSFDTLNTAYRYWQEPRLRGRMNWSAIRTLVLADALGWPPGEVRRIWGRVKRATRMTYLSPVDVPFLKAGYREGEDVPFVVNVVSRKESFMDPLEGTGAPDDPSMQPPPVAGKPAAGDTAKGKGGASVKTTNGSKKKAGKATKKIAAKAAKKATVAVNGGPALPVDTKVRYKGGAQTKKIATGATGVIRQIFKNEKKGGCRYRIRFGEKGKSKVAVVSQKFIAKV